MKATYNTSKEIAELYIESGLKDAVDVRVLINEISKLLAQKYGIERAKEICRPFANASIFTVEGLTAFLDAAEIESVNFSDPMTGKIENAAYINLK